MNIRTLKTALLKYPDRNVRFVLPEGEPIPAAFHVTEVGHVARNFIDCGGTIRSTEACLLQAWVSDRDPEHRLSAGKLARILELSGKVVPSDDLDVEVEYDCGVVAQYTVDAFEVQAGGLTFQLGNKHTDCLARETCGVESAGCGCGPADAQGRCC